jgi:hypothetical protein
MEIVIQLKVIPQYAEHLASIHTVAVSEFAADDAINGLSGRPARTDFKSESSNDPFQELGDVRLVLNSDG